MMTILQEFVLAGVAGLWGLYSFWYWTRRNRRLQRELDEYLVAAKLTRAIHKQEDRRRETDAELAKFREQLYRYQIGLCDSAINPPDPATAKKLIPIGTLMPPITPPSRPGYTSIEV
jgi:hypothetical protein